MYDFSNKTIFRGKIATFVVPFLFSFYFTTFFNGIACMAFQLLFTGLISRIVFKKKGIGYIQFENYLDEIDKIKVKRSKFIIIISSIIGLICLVIFSNWNFFDLRK